MMKSVHRAFPITLAFAMSFASGARAQQLEPRAYANAPVGMDFLIAGDAYSRGGLSTNPALRLANAELQVHTPVAAYAHAFDAWGKSAKFDAIVGGGCLSGSADQDGVLRTRDVCGLLDPAFRLAINFHGAPAITLKEFSDYRQDLIAGASLQVLPPWGQYDPARLVNLGTNRWTLRPEIGVSQAFGALTVELALGANFYTTNHDFYGGKVLEQDPMFSLQSHLIYQFRGGAWVALNGTYYTGGRAPLNGARRGDLQDASRVGATLALAADSHKSIHGHA